jgi:hypothetical protein
MDDAHKTFLVLIKTGMFFKIRTVLSRLIGATQVSIRVKGVAPEKN